MKILPGALALSVALVAGGASAQDFVNLSGAWQCVASCIAPPGRLAYITQNGWNLNVVNEVGTASRAWIDYPGHVWLDRANLGAIYSPSGSTLQFDNGTVWQRAPVLPPPPLSSRG